MSFNAHQTPLACMLTDIVDFLFANPTAVNTDLAGHIVVTYGFDTAQVTNFFTVLGTTLTDAGVTKGPLIADMHVAVQGLGVTKSKALVELVAAGMKADPTLGDELYTLRQWFLGQEVAQYASDIITLDTAIAAETAGPVLDALNSWKLNLQEMSANIAQRIA